jgi:magnesium transporter
LDLTKARIPWLFLGLLGGIGAAAIMGGFESLMKDHAMLFFFSPLIAAMAGNVGVQSSAIVVQALASEGLRGTMSQRLLKEVMLSLLNGSLLGGLLLLVTWVWKGNILTSMAISLSLVSVTLFAGIIGTFIPIFLHKRGVDPAIATGPFITTSNDIFGILIYFSIAKLILGI